MSDAEQVNAVADALRMAVRSGDTELGKTDRKILQAMAAETAATTKRWVRSRVTVGETLVAPLDAIAEDLAHGNLVGSSIDSVTAWAKKQAQTAVLAAVGLAAWPVWVAALAGFVAARMVTVIDYGDRAGFGFAALLAAGIPSGVIYASARAAAAVGNSAPRGLTGLWNAPDHIGLAPERLLRTQVEAPLHALTGQSTGFPVLAKLRGLAKAVVAISLIVTAVAALTFVAAAFDGWDRYWNGCPSGGVRMSDGSCFVLGGP